MTLLREALAAGRTRLPAAEARVLLAEVLGCSAAWLIAHDDDPIDGEALRRYASLTARRAAGEPLAYLLGEREFFGHRFAVGPGVLIPRPETELLVESALDALRANYSGGGTARVLDLGTGSGCVAISVALAAPMASVTAVDASADALSQAQANATRLGARVRFLASDWFSAVAGDRFDIIVGNPPYIAHDDPHLAQGDLRFEPAAALASGTDGLDALRVIIAAAPAHLAAGGWLWLEHGHDQAVPVRTLLLDAGFGDVASRRDLAGIERISGGRVR